MPLDPDIREETYPYFLQEAPELLQALEQGLLDLQDGCSINQINALMRTTHTLKGAAASVGLETIANIAHSLEDIFKVLCRPEVIIDPDVAALLFEGYDCLARPLRAEITGSSINTAEILDRSAAIFAQLEARLGDCFNQEDYLPTSEELGFDITQSMFEVGVTQRLNDLDQTVAQAPHKVAATLQIHAEVFFGLAESLGLHGFGAIAAITLAALDQHPDQAITIAQLALADFQAGCAAVLAGDRTQGGHPSLALQQLVEPVPANVTETSQPDWLTEFDNACARELQQQEQSDELNLETTSDAALTDVVLENLEDLEDPTIRSFELEAGFKDEFIPVELELPLEASIYPIGFLEDSAFILSDTETEFEADTEATIEAATETITDDITNNFIEDITTGDITNDINIAPINYHEIETNHSTATQTSPDSITDTTDTLEEPVVSIASSDSQLEDTSGDRDTTHEVIHASEQFTVEAIADTTETTATNDIEHSTPSLKTHHQKHRGLCKVFQWIRDSFLIQAGLHPDNQFSEQIGDSAEVPATATLMQSSAEQPLEEADPKEVSPKEIPSKKVNLKAEDQKVAPAETQHEQSAALLMETVWAPFVLDELIVQPEGAIADSPSTLSQSLAPGSSITTTREPFQLWPLQEEDSPSLQSQSQTRSQTTSKVADSIASKKHFRSNQVRVNVEHLDQLNYSIGELLTQQNRQSLQNERLQAEVKLLLKRLNQHQQVLSQLQDQVDRQPSQSLSVERKLVAAKRTMSPLQALPSTFGDRFDTLELSRYSDSHLLVQSLLDDTMQIAEAAEAIDLFSQESNQIFEKQQRLLAGTRDALMQARMLPLSEVFNRIPRVLQKLKTSSDKQAHLELHGTEVLVDKAIAEKLYEPLLHLIRNAFDHAIEPVVIRRQQGKPDVGQIGISAYHQGKYLIIAVRDDGKGLDYERIRQRLVERQLVSSNQASTLTQSQLIDFLFEPGFSTVTQVNTTSGRGVGLDVVREQILGLQGAVSVQSAINQGTTFTLQIPLSLAIAKLLICQAGTGTYALTTDAIEQILIPTSEQIQERQGRKILHWQKAGTSQLIRIHSIAKLLNYRSSITSSSPQTASVTSPSDKHVLLVRHQRELIGLEVDQLIGEQELVIRPLGTRLDSPNYVQGASVLADGRLTLVVDGGALLRQVLNQPLAPRSSSVAPMSSPIMEQPPLQTTATLIPTSNSKEWEDDKTILIAEDSITVRQTLTLTLQKAGYQVLQAKDGQEAIEQLQQPNNVRLMFCDLEMPRMNGFEFLKQRQQFPAMAKIPVIVLTSRSGEKHRLLAMELGATAYITKPYIEHKLLGMVADLFEPKEIEVAAD
ncbi:response regulator [Leptolyngbya sp. FACHB-541]|uniref:hybrid sensor histidine kinase/response regulator n=1 Tax=Leptolyngbya sp. FACHB-541 TaxID=2692810 RepID=UPI00168730ED|nr:hybrid sensor histidine kinase/response regulator [Leptolyngbya sp. FACHB-541]MBD1996355.1 response regulator [Leptolyngbya sp. FACHB-541]